MRQKSLSKKDPAEKAIRDMRAIYESRGEEWWDYEEMTRFIREKGIPGVNPHLSQAENRELFHTRNVHRMVELIVLGLDRMREAT